MAIALGIVVVLIALAVLSLIGVRNGIIRERNRCQEAWSNIDVQLKRRHDLVPNLAETVKGYATHEREVFETVSKTRADAMAAHGAGRSAQAEEQLTAALADLRAVAENYPQLRATENFQQLAGALTEIETQIQTSRSTYNADVQAYNTKIQVFPNSIVARWGGFVPMEFFDRRWGRARAHRRQLRKVGLLALIPGTAYAIWRLCGTWVCWSSRRPCARSRSALMASG